MLQMHVGICFVPRTVDLIFTLFFAADVILRVCVLKSKFFKAFVNYIDLAVTCKRTC